MPQFPTNRGTCVVEDGVLRLESSVYGYFLRLYQGNKLLFASVVITVAYFLVIGIFRDPRLLLWGGVGGVAMVVLIRLVNRYRGFTGVDEIPLEAIVEVEAVEAENQMTRSRFVVRYRDGGEVRRRYIMLPSPFHSGTADAFEQGKDVFRSLDNVVLIE